MGLCMLFTEEQIQRLNICNLMNCKINRGNIIGEELNQFILVLCQIVGVTKNLDKEI